MGLLAQLHRDAEAPTGHDCPAWRTWDEVYDGRHGVLQVGLERTACFGECPVYTAVIHATGLVEYQGDWHVDRLGEHRGRVSLYDFRCLAQFIQGTDFREMETSYDFSDCVVSDCASAYVMVVTEGRRKVVSNHGNAGPPAPWAIAELIDSVMRGVTWEGAVNAEPSTAADGGA